MAENNSKTFIIGIVVFVLLVIGGFAFFAKKDVPVDQTQVEATAAPEGAVMEVPAPAPDAVPAETAPAAPEAAVPAAETPAVEAPAVDVAPATETPAEVPAEVPAETPAVETPAEAPAVEAAPAPDAEQAPAQ